MQVFRLAIAVAAMGFALISPQTLGVTTPQLAAGTGGYLLISLLGEWGWRLARRRGLLLFGGMLIADGIYLAWMGYATGGSVSPLRFLVLLHLVAVALLASYRTGLKLAMWHSILLFVVYYAQQARILEPVGPAVRALPGTEFQRLTAFVAVFWMVAMGTATFSAVNERELRRRKYDLEALNSMALKLESAMTSIGVIDTLLDDVVEAFDFPRALVIAGRDGVLDVLGQRGVTESVLDGPRPAADATIQTALHRRKRLLVSGVDPAADPGRAALLPGARNLLIIPMSADGRGIGALVAEHAMRHGSRIERRVVSMVEQFSAQAALALRSAWLLEQVQSMAATDGLTLIGNRRTFETTLEREVTRASRTGEQLSLVMLDIDHFKVLNDTHGHQTGDDVLRVVARAISRECRDIDTPTRYGGEDFAVLLPGCAEDEAVAMAERLRVAIATAGTPVPITTSAGVATFPLHAGDAATLVRVADEALYGSKRNGRNRVTRAGWGWRRGEPSAGQ